MALIAKKPLYAGFTLAANTGNTVSPEMVEKYGWHDDVEDDGRAVAELDANQPPQEPGAGEDGAGKKRRRRTG